MLQLKLGIFDNRVFLTIVGANEMSKNPVFNCTNIFTGDFIILLSFLNSEYEKCESLNQSIYVNCCLCITKKKGVFLIRNSTKFARTYFYLLSTLCTAYLIIYSHQSHQCMQRRFVETMTQRIIILYGRNKHKT